MEELGSYIAAEDIAQIISERTSADDRSSQAKCPVCGGTFKRVHHQQRYCSDICVNYKATHNRCPECGGWKARASLMCGKCWLDETKEKEKKTHSEESPHLSTEKPLERNVEERIEHLPKEILKTLISSCPCDKSNPCKYCKVAMESLRDIMDIKEKKTPRAYWGAATRNYFK